MPHRTFTEEEIAALFERAAELQAHDLAESGLPHKPGLTIDELASIAADVGIDQQHLRRAVAELERAGRYQKDLSQTTSSEIAVDYRVSGHLDEEAGAGIIAELKHRFETSSMESLGLGNYGKSMVQTIGRSIEWQHTNPWTGTRTRVLIQPRDDEVRIRVARNNAFSGSATGWSMWYGVLFAFVAGVLASPVTGSWLTGLTVGLALLVVLIPLMRTFGKRAVDRQRGEIENLADDIIRYVRPAETTAPVQSSEKARLGPDAVKPLLDRQEPDATEDPLQTPRRIRGR